ncbi:MAG: alanine--tRNA ligase [Cytophagales bacterium]
MDSRQIRQQFLDFFKSKQHLIVDSAPLVLKNDPTLMFTNAGMNQFKDYFLGNATPKSRRIADTQKCLRVTGKHNDLEDVGHDTYHHTMFEMLGNWSFGDYFKKEALEWSWELLTEVYKLPKDRLYVSVFGGDPKENLEIDNEAFEIWKRLAGEDKIIYGSKKDNFWEMGDTGPCGPCSEIHIDLRPDEERAKIPGKDRVNNDDPQVIEIWNNVFIQFNRKADGSLEPLPDKHVDTGMGYERLVRAIQNKSSNYDTDVFQPTIQFIAQNCGKKYGDNEQVDIAMRVMADHIRAVSFAIADGQLPSNNKAGYVIRRILRRAVRYGYTFLGFKEPFMTKMVPLLADQFDGVFPELKSQQDFVAKVILEEENSFLKTLDRGLKLIDEYFKSTTSKEVDGKTAFELYDTFGFPYDLTALIARENNFTVDEGGFNQEMKVQKERSKAATKIDTGDWILVKDEVEKTEFVGYDDLESVSNIVKYRQIKQKDKTLYQVVLDTTPFYAESGGQVGDAGYIESDGKKYTIKDSKKENDMQVIFLDKLPENPESPVKCVVDFTKRNASQANHSATHLLHAALKEVLGSHVNQKGSLVNDEILRFDFSHFAKVSDEELKKIESIVNDKIRAGISLDEKRNVPLKEAQASGAMALFGEKYGDFVRMITFDKSFSVELCGGTHVKNTSNIGLFKIISESSVAAGVRRIEAVTGSQADKYIEEQENLINQIKEKLKNPVQLLKALENLVEEKAKLEKQVEKYQSTQIQSLKKDLLAKLQNTNGVNKIIAKVDLESAEAVKSLAFELKQQVENLFCVIGSSADGKPSLAVMISENLVSEKQLNASTIVRDIAKHIQGGGGGQPFFATAGGKNADGLDAALQQAESLV